VRPLSAKEKQVLQMMCEGLTLKEIKYRLQIAYGTVGAYRTRITRKTGCTTAAQLGVWAVRNGIV
jgi:DNA-binding CsgD family transcriptional regulator